MNRIAYKEGYRYVLHDSYIVDTGIVGFNIASGSFLTLTQGGILTIFAGYHWDGASGAIDSPSFMRGSLVHDAAYQLMRENSLPLSYRKRADELLLEICKADGMWAWRRAWVWAAVRAFGGRALESTNPVLTAP